MNLEVDYGGSSSSGNGKLRHWLIEQVDCGKYPGLVWENNEKSVFRIPWKHAGKQDYNRDEDAALFKAWALFKGKFREGVDKPDPPTWKTRLRCALNKSNDFEELVDRSQLDISDPYKVYRIIPESAKKSQITKPLSFADCVGDELPLGWEEVYDQQVGVYYIDHINKTTQIENPRTQWRQEQERMLKEYLVVAQEALRAKKEMYLVKQQRLELAQQEMLLFHELSEDNRSITSTLSGSSSSAKYDPDQIKVEIACRRERLSRLKQELAQVKQELQYKEMGVETLQEIDRKISCCQTHYKLDEAQAIFTELRSIKKAISCGEKERQDLIQSLAKLTVNFQSSSSIIDSVGGEVVNSSGGLHVGDSCQQQQQQQQQQFCDTGCQTDIMGGEYGSQDSSHLVDKVKLNWQHEEAKKKVQSIQHQLAQLDSESWTGRAEADRDRDFLQLLREKEALLQEIILVSRQQPPHETLLQLEEERCRLEEEVQRAHSSQSQGANQRILQQEKRNVLLRQLEEATRITTYLHSQLKSLSASSLTVSTSSSRGSLASSRGSLASSRGSLSSISFSDIYGLPQYERHEGALEPLESHLRYLLPPEAATSRDCSMFNPDPLTQSKTKRSHDTPQSLASLSSRSSLSSLSPPSSPLDTPYHSAPQDCPLTQMTEEYMEQAGRGLLEGLRAQTLTTHTTVMSSEDVVNAATSTATNATVHQPDNKSHRDASAQAAFTSTGVTLRGNSANRSSRRARRVSTGVCEDALATDSGVFEAWGRRTEETEDMSYIKESVSEDTQIQLGLLWECECQCVRLHVLQLKNVNMSVVRDGHKVYVKVHLTPLDVGGACAFYCCSALEPQTHMSFNEGFRVPVAVGALTVCGLQLSVCSLGPQAQEELLGTAQLSLSDCDGSTEMVYHWLRVQMLSGSDLLQPELKNICQRRLHEEEEDEQRPTATDPGVSSLMSHSTNASARLEDVEKKDERVEATSERSWQAESVDSGCGNSTAFTAPCLEGGACAEGTCVTTVGRCGQTPSKRCVIKVEKSTMTDAVFPEPIRVRAKERGGRWGHASPFMRGSTIVRSQTFSPGARSQYVCRLYRSDSDSSTLPKKSPFVRNTLERRTLRYKQQQQTYHSSLAEQPTRTSLDLELDLQACRTRQRQLMEEVSALRELKLRLEEPQSRDAAAELPHWALRDERFRCLLREAQRQASQSKQEQRQEEAVERRMRKASKEVLQMRGQSQKEPLPVHTFRERMAFFTRPRFNINIPPLPADDV
uniref:protein WWC3 n=1 Tax=Solea senegalensis TaxID=28829 RepID=UPI001CD8482E|nr:protein WWC3 [Solea senegalensis]